MSGPEIIKLDGATYNGPDFEERNRKASAEGRAANTETRSAQERADAHARFVVELAEKGMEIGPDGQPRAIENVGLGDTTKRGEEYLKTLPEALATKARLLTSGSLQWPTGRALVDPEWKKILAVATHAYPDLTQDVWTRRHNANMDTRAGGVLGNNAQAINTALGHMQHLWDEYKNLGNTRFPVVNGVVQPLRENVGDTSLQNHLGAAETAAEGVANELSRVLMGGKPNEAEVAAWRNTMDLTAPPERFKGFMRQAVGLMKKRLESSQHQYDDAMQGAPGSWQAMSPTAQKAYHALVAEVGGEGEVDTTHQDVFAKPPEGMSVAGEDIRGYRFAPEQEKALRDFARSGAFDPAKFADMAASFVGPQGVRVDDAWRASMAEQGTAQHNYFRENPTAPDAPFDYSNVDKAASENAGLGDALSQTLKNLPESAYNLATGLMAPATDAVRSLAAGKPEGFYSLAAGLVTDPAATAKQVGDVYAEDYGGVDNIKRKLMRDPLGAMGDASMVLSGGAGLLRRGLPGLPGVADAVAQSARRIDPVSGMHALLTRGAPGLYSRLPESMRHYAAELPFDIAAFPSGVGGQTLREGFNAGRSHGLAGAETPQSRAFQSNRRQEPGAAEGTVGLARNGVDNLRRQASADYQAGMADLGQNPPQLSMEPIFEQLNALKPADYDLWTGFEGTRPPEHAAWERMRDGVVHYAQQATANPALLEPLQLDRLKQTLFDIGQSTPGNGTDPAARRIASRTREAVRGVISEADPTYRDTMANYGDAMGEIGDLEDTFALGDRRGGLRGPNTDSAARRLQSIFRNNANTNYGLRAQRGERLAELDPTGTLMPSLAGQSSSSWAPRGLRGGVTLGELVAHYLATGSAVSPATLPILALASPRVAGKAAHAAGRAVGTAERVASPRVRALNRLYEQHPELALTMQRAQAAQDREDERQSLAAKYGIEVPGAVDFGE